MKWTLEQEAVEVVKNFDLLVNTEEALRFVMAYADENKHIINCAFDSMGYEESNGFSTMIYFQLFTERLNRWKMNCRLPWIHNSKTF